MLTEFESIAPFYDSFYEGRDDDLQMYGDFAMGASGPILELGCGTGRILVPLAAEGHRITGLELSPAMLRVAQAKIDRAGVNDRATLVEADMRDFEISNRFALAIIPINTFMHCYSIEQQLSCLTCTHRHLRSGGQLVLDVYHPDPQSLLEADGRLISDGTSHNPQTKNVIHRLHTRRLDLANQIQHITYILDEIEPGGVVRRTMFRFRMRFVYRYEMELLLRTAGYNLEAVYGSYDLEPFETDSERMIFVARVD